MPQRKIPPPRAGLSVGQAAALALACSLVSSAVTAWAVLYFHARPDATQAPPAEAAAQLPPTRPTARTRPPPVSEPAESFDGAVVISDRAPSSAAYAASATAQVLTTAVATHDLVSSLQAEFNNAYFAGRTGLKNDLNAVQAAAARMQTALADGATAEAVAQNAATLAASLDRTIARLENLIPNTKDENQVEASRLIKGRLEEMRAALPATDLPPR